MAEQELADAIGVLDSYLPGRMAMLLSGTQSGTGHKALHHQGLARHMMSSTMPDWRRCALLRLIVTLADLDPKACPPATGGWQSSLSLLWCVALLVRLYRMSGGQGLPTCSMRFPQCAVKAL